MKLIDAYSFGRKLHEIGGCGAPPESWAAGWGKAIDEAIEMLRKEPEVNPEPLMVEEWEIMRHAIDTYGVEKQCDVAVEEMAELTKALMKIRRTDGYAEQRAALDNVIEEIADVSIMADQLRIMWGPSDVDKARNYKLRRLEDRINERR